MSENDETLIRGVEVGRKDLAEQIGERIDHV